MSEPVGNGPREVIPSNSHKTQREATGPAEPREKLEKMVEGEAITRKPAWYRRAASSFIADDADTIKEYIMFDVLLPSVKNLLFDIITQATGRALYPGGRVGGIRGSNIIMGGGMRGSQQSIRTQYDKMATGGSPDPRRELSREAHAQHDFRDVILPHREEAVSVVSRMIELVEQYGTVTVSDLYDLVGITSGTWADQNWGWRDLRDANVVQSRGGWLLDLPRPTALRS